MQLHNYNLHNKHAQEQQQLAIFKDQLMEVAELQLQQIADLVQQVKIMQQWITEQLVHNVLGNKMESIIVVQEEYAVEQKQAALIKDPLMELQTHLVAQLVKQEENILNVWEWRDMALH